MKVGVKVGCILFVLVMVDLPCTKYIRKPMWVFHVFCITRIVQLVVCEGTCGKVLT